jgi:hypothetical protein
MKPRSDDVSSPGGVATASPTRPALGRMLEIHALLQRASAGQRINCSVIAERFKRGGHRYSTKTIQRDITFMRNRLGLPIEYDRVDHSYAYHSPDVTFPVGRDLSADERVALEVARQSLAVFEGVNFAELIGSAYAKLFGAHPTKHGLSLEGDFAQYVSVRTPGAGIVDRKVFRAVVMALLGTSKGGSGFAVCRDSGRWTRCGGSGVAEPNRHDKQQSLTLSGGVPISPGLPPRPGSRWRRSTAASRGRR